MAYELSVIIPSRQEPYIQKTIDDVLANVRGATQVIVGFDGDNPYIRPHKDLKILHSKQIGQRALTNKLVGLSRAKFILKCDAHCSFSQGFDVAMMKDMQDDVTLVPVLLNLRPYEWVCSNGHTSPHSNKQPKSCNQCNEVPKRNETWQIIPKPVTSSFVFNSDLIFEYAKEQSPLVLSETMAIQGSGWMVSRKKYWELNLSDEKFGSWGQQGVEIACKTWFSGGRVINTKNAYMGHWFRQEDEFPYERDMEQVKHAHTYSKELFLKHPKMPWLVEKFGYPADWTKEKLCTLQKK